MSAAPARYYEDDPQAAEAGAIAALLAGGAVIFPTDTVYGLFAAADSVAGYRRIFELKRRQADKPLALLALAEHPLALRAAELLGKESGALLAEFKSGMLTAVLPAEAADDALTSTVRAIQPGAVGVRCPADARTQGLLRRLGGLAWATSVNESGEPPCTSAQMVLAWLNRIAEPVHAVLSRDDLSGSPSSVVLLDESGIKRLR